MAEYGWMAVVAGFILILVGMALIFVGVLWQAVRGGGSAEVGGVVVIGPLPIVFGSSERAFMVAAVLGIILLVLAIALFVLLSRGFSVPGG
ncbi:MAG: DUF131 domain-containing protein [Desulfurococcales archaeon]|nr:DUF131 domain-containing protein [Desulfurococcales archaeon]